MRLVLLFLFFIFNLFSIERSTPDEIANLESQPSAIVGGYINVTTGDFVYRKNELTVKGATPLVLDRFFCSREQVYHSEKWEVLHHHRATLHQGTLYIQEESGVAIPYKKVAKRVYKPDESFFKDGTTFNSLHDPRLNHVEFDGKKLTLTQSDGRTRIFRSYWVRKKEKITELVLRSETLLNGQIKEYKWDIFKNILYGSRKPYLEKVSITSPDGKTTFSSVTYAYKRKKQILASGSNGKTLEYKTTPDSEGSMGYIYEIISPDHPKQTHKRNKQYLTQSYTLGDDQEIKLEYTDTRVKLLELPEGLKYHFVYHMGETIVTNPDYSSTKYYHSRRRLNKVVYYSNGRSLLKTEVFTWGSNNKLKQKEILDDQDQTVLKVEYSYDDRNNLTSQKITGKICNKVPETLTTQYEYDTLHRLTKESACTGKTTTYRYLNKTHLPIEVTERKHGLITRRILYTYDENHLLISETTDAGNSSPITYKTDIFRQIEGPYIGMPRKTETYCNDELLGKTYYRYNEYGDVQFEDTYGSDGKYSHHIETTYNEYGLLTTRRDEMGYKTHYSYNSNRTLRKEKRPTGLTIKRRYDKLGRVAEENAIGGNETQTTEYVYQNHFEPVAVIDHMGNALSHRYDSLGRINKTSLPNKGIITYTYNALGHLTSETDPNGNTTHITPNIFGQPVEIRHPDGTKETYTYTKERQVESHIDQNNTLTRFKYDHFGNPKEETLFAPDGHELCQRERTYSAFQLLKEVDTEGYTTYYTYNNRNQLVKKKRANLETTYTYTPLGRLHQETTGDYTKAYTYDQYGNVTLEEEYHQNELLTKVKTQYNSSNNPISITRYPNNQPATTTIDYDPFGRPTKKTDAESNTCTFYYEANTTTTHLPGDITTIETRNKMGQLATYTKYDYSDNLLEEKNLEYDLAGNLTSKKSQDYSIHYSYDSMNRKNAQLECGIRQTVYTYTPKGELATLEKPDSTILTYTYDPFGCLRSLTSSSGDINYRYIHNTFGQLLASQDKITGTQTLRKLDPEGNILKETLANGHTLSYTHKANTRQSMTLPTGEIITYTHRGPYTHTITCRGMTHTIERDLTGSPIQETTITGSTIFHTYDRLGRPETLNSNYLSQACTYTPQGNISSILQDGITKTYTYDTQDHLTSEPGHTYTYDHLDNRTSHNNTHYTHTTLNEIDTYIYDENGNLLDDGETTYAYDSLDRLIRIGDKSYTYDAQHRRMDLIWDHDQELGTLDQLRILDPNHPAEHAIAIITPTTTLLPVHDLQYNLIKIFTLQNELIETHSLSVFGEVTKTPSIPWTFCSKRTTGKLLYFGRRYYSPSDGRFINPDPIGYTDGYNLYAYGCNNPLIYFDPKGLYSDIISTPNIYPRADPAVNPSFMNYDQFWYKPEYVQIGTQQYINSFTPPEISRSHHLGRPDVQDRIVISVNGMNNSYEESRSHMQYLSNMYNGNNIHGVYNASNGVFSDTCQAGLSMLRKYTNPESELLSKLTSYFKDAGPEATALLVPHSHGAIITRNVLEMLKDSEIKDRIYVIAIAPGAYINPNTCAFVRHYVHPNDLVPRLDWFGKLMFGHTIERVGRFRPYPYSSTHHNFQDPVYRPIIKTAIETYMTQGTL